MSTGFSKVRPKYLALMAEMYGRFAGLIPYYFENNFMYVSVQDYNSYVMEEKKPSMDDANKAMFSCSWSEDDKPTVVVANAFTDYVHTLGKINGSQEVPVELCEENTLSYVMETVMSFESVVSNVFQDLKKSTLSVPETPKIILPH